MGLNCQLWRSYDVTATPKSKTQYINLTVVTRPFIWAIASRRTIRMHGDIGQNVWNWHIFKLCPKMAHYLQLFLEQPYHQKMRHNALFPFRWYVGGGTASVKKVIRKKPNFYGSFNFWHILAQRKCDNRFLTTDPDWPLDGKFFWHVWISIHVHVRKVIQPQSQKIFQFSDLAVTSQPRPNSKPTTPKDAPWKGQHLVWGAFWYPRWFKSYGQKTFLAPHFWPYFSVFGTQWCNRKRYQVAVPTLFNPPYSDHFATVCNSVPLLVSLCQGPKQGPLSLASVTSRPRPTTPNLTSLVDLAEIFRLSHVPVLSLLWVKSYCPKCVFGTFRHQCHSVCAK